MPDLDPSTSAPGQDLRAAFLAATDHVVAIVSRDDVAATWDQPSALPEWDVGGLVAHLASQPSTAVRLLRAEPATDSIPLDEHYARSAWVSAALEDEVNVSIRAGGDQQAALGRDEVLAGVLEAREVLPELLAAQPADRAVLIPWAGWALRRDDFLTGRMMEVVVHGEDVAASVGFESPPLPDYVLQPVLRLLTRLAVRRHGQGAVVSALTRSERSGGSISAF
ncbi:maleylpyruvate isomerase N-terminal domain-containing protein [Terrabacter sp. MAHUQ-38]|uniref:maleylpyruvate isomerase N-terminal domain-containing protein n=1 Tax=unclassified Terrabacter TaxID=2630222 RepID=UPI00165DBE6F|nr:maleylpyruvate isomerase N-terminal domain-containing protein [Terrabacter sp. MAHUQ-38]MBC9821774.1 maleylpyruvate isomerase N-terminal domain-containing protein [Terrabacter sp. MAHUQ-38]